MSGRKHKLNEKNKKEPIALFYWSEKKFIFRDKENYGDLLSKYLVEKISGRRVRFVHPKKQPWYKWNKKHYLTVGSIIHHATRDSVVWGSGIIDKKQKVAKADFRAVRGPRTRDFLIKEGYICPEVYGDPALLLPFYYNPKIKKDYNLGIIPHYHDFEQVKKLFVDNSEVLIIDLLSMDVEFVTRQILSCEKCISSSLHGIIVAQAYNIPAVWVKFSNKIFGDDVKYIDYLESVDLIPYTPPEIRSKVDVNEIFNYFKVFPSLVHAEKLKSLQKGLMQTCPFFISS